MTDIAIPPIRSARASIHSCNRGPQRARAADAAAVAAFLRSRHGARAPSTADLKAALRRPDTAFFIQRSRGRIRGVIGCTLDGGCAHLHHFDAGPTPDEHRAAGLLRAACRFARAAGVTVAAASVEDGSRAAVLLQQAGFACDGREAEAVLGRLSVWLELVKVLDAADECERVDAVLTSTSQRPPGGTRERRR